VKQRYGGYNTRSTRKGSTDLRMRGKSSLARDVEQRFYDDDR